MLNEIETKLLISNVTVSIILKILSSLQPLISFRSFSKKIREKKNEKIILVCAFSK